MGGEAANYGVILLNMGGPADLAGVQDYIYQLLADPDMIRFPGASVLQKPLARMIAKARAPKVKKRYELIGGSSPIDAATAAQAQALESELSLPVTYAMRYTPPAVDSALKTMAARNVSRLVVITLYPQYSTVSTRSSLRDFELQAKGTRIESRVVDRHFNNPEYIAAMQAGLRNALEGIDPALRTRILFTAHSIPEAYVKEGDPYPSEIARTAALVHAGIADAPPYALAYQSQVGPVRWQGPALEEMLAELVRENVQQLVVQCLSFVSENLETLFDLDIDFKEKCNTAGIRAYHRVPTPTLLPLYIQALAGMARDVIAGWEGTHA